MKKELEAKQLEKEKAEEERRLREEEEAAKTAKKGAKKWTLSWISLITPSSKNRRDSWTRSAMFARRIFPSTASNPSWWISSWSSPGTTWPCHFRSGNHSRKTPFLPKTHRSGRALFRIYRTLQPRSSPPCSAAFPWWSLSLISQTPSPSPFWSRGCQSHSA